MAALWQSKPAAPSTHSARRWGAGHGVRLWGGGRRQDPSCHRGDRRSARSVDTYAGGALHGGRAEVFRAEPLGPEIEGLARQRVDLPRQVVEADGGAPGLDGPAPSPMPPCGPPPAVLLRPTRKVVRVSSPVPRVSFLPVKAPGFAGRGEAPIREAARWAPSATGASGFRSADAYVLPVASRVHAVAQDPHSSSQCEPGGASWVAMPAGIPTAVGQTELPRSNNAISLPESSKNTVAPSP